MGDDAYQRQGSAFEHDHAGNVRQIGHQIQERERSRDEGVFEVDGCGTQGGHGRGMKRQSMAWQTLAVGSNC